MAKSITTWILEIKMIPFKKKFTKGFGNNNTIAVMEKVDIFDWIELPIRVNLIEINPEVGTQLSLEFQILFCLHYLRS